MSLDWSKISPLASPIITTGDDVILSGHGKYASSGDTIVPGGIEFWVMAPPGATITNDLGQALESMNKINKLGIYSTTTNELSKTLPMIYVAGKTIPNYILQSPNGLVLKPQGPHLIGVAVDTKLSDLWAKVNVFVKPGKVTRVFWAACTAINGAQNQTIYHQ